ncbi:hypothetical protein L7F22_000822 [Adiantum nelumboides]|nr:hypothetical protein [Adiantum nelumboides]
MKLRQRAESVKYAADSEEDEGSVASQNVLVMNQRMRKVKAGSDLDSGSLLRYAQPNVKNTSADSRPLPEIPVVVEDSDEDFMEARVSQRKRTTSPDRKGRGSPRAKRNVSCRSVRKSYKELSSSEEEDVDQNKRANVACDLSVFAFKKERREDEVQKALVPGRRRLVKAVTSPKDSEDSPCVLSADDTKAFSNVEASKPCKLKSVLSKSPCTSILGQQDLTKTETATNAEDMQVPMALNLHVDAYGLCTLEGASICKMVKRPGQVEKILAVQNKGTDSTLYCIKECGKNYRDVCAVKEDLLKSKYPQLLRNFCKRMDELERVNGNPGDREDAPAFNPLYLQVERIIGQEDCRQ